jgi:proliferating cell nuclear antigen
MKLMDIDSDNLNIPETDYDSRVTLPSSEFARIVRDLSQLGESVRIEVSKEGVRFASDGEAANGSVLLKQSDGREIGKVEVKKEDDEEENGDDDEEEEEGEKKPKVKKEKTDDDVEMDEENKEKEEFQPGSDDDGEEEVEEVDDDSSSKKRKKVRWLAVYDRTA